MKKRDLIWVAQEQRLNSKHEYFYDRNAASLLLPYEFKEFSKEQTEILASHDGVVFHGIFSGLTQLKRMAWCGLVNKYTPLFYEVGWWTEQLAPLCLNHKGNLIPFNLLNDSLLTIYSELSQDGKIFIRPNTGEKKFTGQLLEPHQIKQLADIVTDDELLFIAKPKNIQGEWRFVISNRRVLTGSTYCYGGLRCQIPAVHPKAEKLANIASLLLSNNDPLYTIDIVETTAGDFFVMEVNSFACASLYCCNKEKIIAEINSYE